MQWFFRKLWLYALFVRGYGLLYISLMILPTKWYAWAYWLIHKLRHCVFTNWKCDYWFLLLYNTVNQHLLSYAFRSILFIGWWRTGSRWASTISSGFARAILTGVTHSALCWEDTVGAALVIHVTTMIYKASCEALIALTGSPRSCLY